MLNAEMIRINTIEKIPLDGYMVKLSLYTKTEEERWKRIVDGFKERLEASMTDSRNSQHVKIMQSNNTDKCNFHVPKDSKFNSISSLMKFCHEYCDHVKENEQIDLHFVSVKTNLEQTFLAYAIHQKVNDTINN